MAIIVLGRDTTSSYSTARRRAAAKRKKLKHLGKSRSTDTEDEENEDEPDEGIIHLANHFPQFCTISHSQKEKESACSLN